MKDWKKKKIAPYFFFKNPIDNSNLPVEGFFSINSFLITYILDVMKLSVEKRNNLWKKCVKVTLIDVPVNWFDFSWNLWTFIDVKLGLVYGK